MESDLCSICSCKFHFGQWEPRHSYQMRKHTHISNRMVAASTEKENGDLVIWILLFIDQNRGSKHSISTDWTHDVYQRLWTPMLRLSVFIQQCRTKTHITNNDFHMAETWKHNRNPVVLNRFDFTPLLVHSNIWRVVLIRNPYLVYLLEKNQRYNFFLGITTNVLL